MLSSFSNFLDGSIVCVAKKDYLLHWTSWRHSSSLHKKTLFYLNSYAARGYSSWWSRDEIRLGSSRAACPAEELHSENVRSSARSSLQHHLSAYILGYLCGFIFIYHLVQKIAAVAGKRVFIWFRGSYQFCCYVNVPNITFYTAPLTMW